MPPVIGALFVSDLGKILDFAGLVGFAIMFFFPLALQWHARTMCVELFGRRLGWRTPVGQRYFAHPAFMALFLAFSVVAFCAAGVELVKEFGGL